MSIELHIERLVIDAAVLGSERVGDVRAAIEQELARVLTQPGAIAALRGIGTVERLPVAQLPPLRDGHHPLGGRIAATVGQRLGLADTTRLGSATHHG